MGAVGIKVVNIINELERIKVRWEAVSENEIRVLCPAHEDSSPSASINTEDHVWKCFVPSCGAHGDFVSFLAYALHTERRIVLVDLQTRYPDIAGISEIPSNTVERFHENLAKAGPLLKELDARGVTQEMMRDARIGFHEGRITIPIYDQVGRCVNVRRYLPGAPGNLKMKSTTGHGAPAIYRINYLRPEDKVLICGGEMKALVAGTLLHDHGFCAVCSTGGEGHWRDDWVGVYFANRDVYICLDIDDAGVSAARNIAMKSYGKAAKVFIVRLPLDKAKHPKGDINDWVGHEGATAADLLALIKSTPPWSPPTKAPSLPKTGARRTPLDKAITNASVGEHIEFDAVIAAADQTPFLVPKDVDVECTRDQPGCTFCPVKTLRIGAEGYSRMVVESGSPAVLNIAGSTEKEQAFRIADALGVPMAQCKTVKFFPRSHHIVHDVRVSPPLDLAGGRVGDAWYPAMVVTSTPAELNVPCRMRGAVHPHPKTQQAVALINDMEELEDTLSNFDPSPLDIKLLTLLQPRDKSIEAMSEQIDMVYRDLESNVTWIFQRRDMHFAYDLAWHSPLLFNFCGRQVNGWLNLLVIGDSSQGKSECAHRLLRHYGCGDKVDCKNATVAGLLGGLEQLGNRWFVRWGTIPQRDRMLVILEEMKGMAPEVFAKCTEMRSSGIAEIPKIERKRALARTRLIGISNPRSPRPMASYHFGIEAIHELIGSLEDVRRFDLALAVCKGEVSDEIINAVPSSREKVPHVFTGELCRKAVLWSWTRKPEQILIGDETTDAIVKLSISLCEKFNETVPLVDQGTIRLKVARMACALAARLFSSPDGVQLAVEPTHVEMIGRFIDRVYSSPGMGYAAFSSSQRLMSKISDVDEIISSIRKTRHPKDFVSNLMRTDRITLEDLMAGADMEYDHGRRLLSLFVRKGALLRLTKNEYSKNPELITILRSMHATAPKEYDSTGEEF